MDIASRIKELRKTKKLSQVAFGERLGVSRDVINNVENGRVELSELMLKAICSEFNISEEWLRHGFGAMFLETDRTVISTLSNEYNLDPLDQKIVECYLNLGTLQRKVIKDCLRSLVDAVLSDENYDDYREDYLKENAGTVAARGGHAEKIDELQDLYDNSDGEKK